MTEALERRQSIHRLVAPTFASLSDQQLKDQLTQSEALSVGIGGNKRLLKVGGHAVFVKEVPLTEWEARAENRFSTLNHFDLPLYYQYGLSSAGFSAWRELAAQEMVSHWVLEGACPCFPLLYHWRVLKRPQPPSLNPAILKEVDRSVKYWGGSEAIRARLLAKHTAAADLVLFMEYLPETLDKWLGLKVHQSEAEIEKACDFVPKALFEAIGFMNAKGLLHFDAHLNNILTDGSSIYLADFGLAIASSFDLSEEEQDFFKKHADYDQSLARMSLVHRVLAAHYSTKERARMIEEYAAGKGEPLASPALTKLVRRYAPVSLTLKNFNDRLLFESKETIYPAEILAEQCYRCF